MKRPFLLFLLSFNCAAASERVNDLAFFQRIANSSKVAGTLDRFLNQMLVEKEINARDKKEIESLLSEQGIDKELSLLPLIPRGDGLDVGKLGFRVANDLKFWTKNGERIDFASAKRASEVWLIAIKAFVPKPKSSALEFFLPNAKASGLDTDRLSAAASTAKTFLAQAAEDAADALHTPLRWAAGGVKNHLAIALAPHSTGSVYCQDGKFFMELGPPEFTPQAEADIVTACGASTSNFVSDHLCIFKSNSYFRQTLANASHSRPFEIPQKDLATFLHSKNIPKCTQPAADSIQDEAKISWRNYTEIYEREQAAPVGYNAPVHQ